MPAKYLCEAIKIWAYIRDQQAKVKVAKKKAANQKKKLLKVQEVLKRVDEEIKYF